MNAVIKRELSEQAKVAKLCRQYLKSIGVKGQASSSSFSMGDSVDVSVNDLNPDLYKQIKDEFSQYQYGHFDGMNDIYEYSNRNRDIPQTKYLSVDNHYSDELRQKAWEFLYKKYPGK